ncbi:MAG: Lhr-like helicase [Haloquadratum walsbyi J07HQW1]|uniref:Lhr-like helicase n=1 Tax=Haloquadratum walsbyi J07HQW1 TaxID=1238424 RepID=U1N885_9EURY|nr:MAG: Lhr-like helicase [Haloquadratum walsbyi J07HQW1]
MSQRGRALLREAAEQARTDADKTSFTFDPETVEINDADVLTRLDPAVQEWWVSQFGRYVAENDGFFTPPQREAIPLVDNRENALVCAPTGSGKTLASFTAVLNDLFKRARKRDDGLENQVYCLYISPLKSLANDIHRNLGVPLSGIRERIIADAKSKSESESESESESKSNTQSTNTAATDGSSGSGEDVDSSLNVRHAIRHGDTDSAERQRMLEETPHILNTTPETLAILLNAPKFREKLRGIEYVIVDEIHSLAANKRGTHLSVSLERLEELTETSPTRIGCSATVEPLSTVGKFLVGYNNDGTPREYELVDTRFVREFDLSVECPTDDLIYTPRGKVQARFYDRLEQLIDDHTNTIVFTNTRSGAERVLSTLRDRSDTFDESNSGCHHGSLSKTRRQEIESELKAGTLDVVTTSTSLELGIDMPHVDLVVQVGSPKSVAALLQRVGRAGHQLGETVEGRVIALDRDELVECAVMLQKAESGFVDRVFIPEGAHDVASQQIYGMAINEIRREATFRQILTRAYPYRNYDDDDWEELLRYLTADYDGLDEKDVYPKIWRDTNDAPSGEHHYEEFPVGAPLIGKRGRLARVIYMTNIGTIPDSFSCTVLTRSEDKQVGTLDEDYLDTLETGDVFVLGGDRFEYRYRRGSKVYVDRTSERPTVPSWFSERLPLSYDLGREIASFQGEVINRLEADGVTATRQWLDEFPIDANSARAITRIYDQQRQYTGATSVSTDDRLVVEEELDRDSYRRRFYIHSTYGRRFNDGLSRLLAYHCAQQTNANVKIAVADNGFTLVMPLNRKVDVGAVLESIEPAAVRSDLRSALDGTDLLKRYFRINATRSLMILKRYKGYEKSAAQQQVSSEMLLSFAEELDSFAVIDETYREILEDKLNVDAIEDALRNIQDDELIVETVQVDSPSPRAFGLATLAASDVVLAEDESAVLQEFHARVQAEIGDEETASETETQTSSS